MWEKKLQMRPMGGNPRYILVEGTDAVEASDKASAGELVQLGTCSISLPYHLDRANDCKM